MAELGFESRSSWWLRWQRICLQCRRPGFNPWVRKKRMAIHSSILAWRIPWTEKPDGLQTWGGEESDTTEWLTVSLSHLQSQLSLLLCKPSSASHPWLVWPLVLASTQGQGLWPCFGDSRMRLPRSWAILCSQVLVGAPSGEKVVTVTEEWGQVAREGQRWPGIEVWSHMRADQRQAWLGPRPPSSSPCPWICGPEWCFLLVPGARHASLLGTIPLGNPAGPLSRSKIRATHSRFWNFLVFRLSNRCWQFDLWFLSLF